MHRQKTEHPQKTGHLQKMGRAKTTVYAPAAARNSLRPGMGGLLVLLGVFLGGAFGVGAFGVAWAADWPSWRGPEQDGVSRETGLPLVWSPGDKGENLVWKRLEGARSTPVLHDGRVFVVSRIGEGVNEQERVLCAEASTGKLIWEYRFNVFLTDIPSARVGWSSPTVDPETGHVFAHGVQNIFVCLDRSGNVVWERSLHEELGVIMGYGGRTHTPVVDGDFVILSFLNSSWGSQNRGRHRYAAFDKKTGAIAWWAEPGGPPRDTTYSTPVIGEVNGVRLLIGGNADGAVYALKVQTGETVWRFALSKRGINSSVVFSDNRVFAAHSEENLDSAANMGRLVCIDATGTGDVTKTHEKWRIDGFLMGYSSPAVHGGRVYAIDNSANLVCINIPNGQELWKVNLGRVMKGSPVIADGKIYVGETNGKFLILELGEISAEVKSEVEFSREDGTVVEIFGSPAISNGRVYFATTDGIYCLGNKVWKGKPGTPPAKAPTVQREGKSAPVLLQVVPADVVVAPGATVNLKGRLFDAKGRLLGTCSPKLVLKGVRGFVPGPGEFTVSDENVFQHGVAVATLETLTATARVRVVPAIPFENDFDSVAEGKPPAGWVGAGIKFVGASLDDNKVLTKVGKNAKFMDAETFFGLPTWSDYTLEADVRGSEVRFNMPNIGLVNSRYSFVLMGNHQRFRIVSWVPEPRIEVKTKFAWDPDKWYRLKTTVAQKDGKALARAKIWPRDQPEPEKWTLELEDPTPNPSGAPALHGYSAGITDRSPGAKIFFDNVKVTKN